MRFIFCALALFAIVGLAAGTFEAKLNHGRHRHGCNTSIASSSAWKNVKSHVRVAFVNNLRLASSKAAIVAALENDEASYETIMLENTKRAGKRSHVARAEMLATARKELSDSIVTLKNSDPVYAISIYVGTPGQEIAVIPDTGSTHLVITSVYCEEAGCKQADHSYDPVKSSTYKSMTPAKLRKQGRFTAISITYGSGELTAILGDDTVRVGEVETEHVVFGQIMKEVGQVFMIDGFDGIMGISAPHDGSPQIAAAAVDLKGTNEVMADQHVLSKNCYGFFFSYDANVDGRFFLPNSDDDLSGYTWHTLRAPPTEYDGTISEGIRPYWELTITDIRVGGRSLELCGDGKDCSAIIDTGTTLMVGGATSVAAIEAQLKIDANCANYDDLPDIDFVFDDEVYTLTKDDYLFAAPQFETRDRKLGPYNLPEVRQSIICASAFIADSLDSPMMPTTETWILGVAFLRRYESIFDYDNKRIGFKAASHADNDKPVQVGHWVSVDHTDADSEGWKPADPTTLFS